MQQEFLLTTVLLAATALCALSFLHWKGRNAQPVDPGKKSKPLPDELLREAPRLNKSQSTEEKLVKKTDESSRQAGDRINRLFESTKSVNDHFGVFGGARPPESQDRKGRRP